MKLCIVLFQVNESHAAKSQPQEQQKAKPKEKKEHLTKSQKRKMVNRLDNKGELPRGYDWVDVIKHLSQTGHQEKKETT